jgi:hypothetical protein
VQSTRLEIKETVAHAGRSLLSGLLSLVTRSHMVLSIVYPYSNCLIAAIMEGVAAVAVGFKMPLKTT